MDPFRPLVDTYLAIGDRSATQNRESGETRAADSDLSSSGASPHSFDEVLASYAVAQKSLSVTIEVDRIG